MKPRTPAPLSITLAPAASGWRILSPGSAPRHAATLEAASVVVESGAVLQLALPCSAVLFERMKLPSTDAGELGDMMRLQLEKTLPFAPEEITSGFQIIEKNEHESTLLSATVNNEQLRLLCEPLCARALLPEKITVFAMRAAAACPPDPLALLIYREAEKIVLAICQRGTLAHLHPINVNDAAGMIAELPQFVLGAEMDGIPVAFERILLDESCDDLKSSAADFFNLPAATISLDAPPHGPDMNLLPAEWRLEKRRMTSRAQLRSQLILAGVVYLILVLGAMGWLFGMNFRVKKIDAELQRAAPDLAAIGSRKARWEALLPSIDPARYTVELLFQITKSIPSEAIRITVFDQGRDQFMIQGEAPTANAAIEFGEQLKKNPELKAFKLTVAPPTILPDDRAQFRIIGKL